MLHLIYAVVNCRFTTQYYDYQKRILVPYHCPEQEPSNILDSGFCIFHDRRFRQNEEKIRTEFQKKIEEYLSNSNNKPLLCIGYHLIDVDIRDKEFLGPVYFDETRFYGFLTIHSKFTSDVSFTNCKFLGEGDIDFGISEFFNGYVGFNGAEFSNKGGVGFDRARFSGGYVGFSALFSNKGGVGFSAAEFTNKRDIFFGGAVFSNEGAVSFDYAMFSNERNIIFDGAVFSNQGEVIFTRVKFFNKGYVNFSNAKFFNKGFVQFDKAEFSGQTFFDTVEFKKFVFLSSVNFSSQEKVRFRTEDLSKVSFANTDVSRIFFDENTRFSNLEAKTSKGRVRTFFKSFMILNKTRFEKFKILDETRFEECIDKKNESNTISKLKASGLSLGSVLTSYRNLRENYEYRLRYDEAGQFFVREMEVRRNYREELTTDGNSLPRKNGWPRRNFFSFIGLYRNICNYGESSTRPLILFSIILLLSTAYWFVSSLIGLPLQNDLVTTDCPEHPVFCSLERTLNDIVGFPEKGIFIDYVTRITSIIVLATLFLPFRRKFERRFRH